MQTVRTVFRRYLDSVQSRKDKEIQETEATTKSRYESMLYCCYINKKRAGLCLPARFELGPNLSYNNVSSNLFMLTLSSIIAGRASIATRS